MAAEGSGGSVGKEKKIYGDVENEQDLFSKSKKRFYRKTQTELVIGYVVHVVLLGFYVFVRVYEATVIKRMSTESKEIAFPWSGMYGGRWRFLTYINLWVQTVYFFFAFFVDVMPQSAVKVFLSKTVDFFFTTVAFPLAMIVFVSFWGIFAINREMVYPSVMDEHIPLLLNHFWHTTVAVCVLVELLLVYHKYPNTTPAAIFLFLFSTSYVMWICFLFVKTNKWPYPFLYEMSPPVISLFFAGCFVITLLLFFLGRWLSRMRFGNLEPLPDTGEKED